MGLLVSGGRVERLRGRRSESCFPSVGECFGNVGEERRDVAVDRAERRVFGGYPVVFFLQVLELDEQNLRGWCHGLPRQLMVTPPEPGEWKSSKPVPPQVEQSWWSQMRWDSAVKSAACSRV